MNNAVQAEQVARRLDELIERYPYIRHNVYRQFLIAIHTRGLVTIDQVQQLANTGLPAEPERIPDNEAERDRWNTDERDRVEHITREYVSRHFTLEEVEDLVNLTLKQEKIHHLEDTATLANVTFGQLAAEVRTFCELPTGETQLAPSEVMGTRVALIRHLVSDQLEFIGIAKNHLQIRDFNELCSRIIGRTDGMGRIGGKAGGMLLACKILERAELSTTPFLPVAMPVSYYLRSDVVEDFLRLNRFNEYQNQKYKPIDEIARDYMLIKGVFRNGDFPHAVISQLRGIMAELGTHPVIVRSSSLLEDRYGVAFCGKYASVFVPNQGTEQQRERALLGAIAEVYASVLAPDPILYRREHNLIDYVEEMAVLIQKVVGTRVGDYFLPAFAGVAFSRNEYRWSPRIRREDGLMRIVAGLGTRAVDRAGSDYPRMVALGEPTLRPESKPEEILSRAQQTLDVIDLKNNRFRNISVAQLLREAPDFPHLDKIISLYRDGDLYPPTGRLIDPATFESARPCITFDKLLRNTTFPRQMHDMLRRLEDVYGVPVDIEFACDAEKLYILQCRTQSELAVSEPVAIPQGIPKTDVVFDAHRFVRTGISRDVTHIVYVDPTVYDAIETRERRVEIARVVGKLNHTLARKRFILVGPGRWGSNDIRLGVPVRYADVNRCAVLIEVARQRGNFVPEVSFGTHFFQDLVEAGILYLPLYPDEPGNRFNEDIFLRAPNSLARLLPAEADYEPEVRVIDIPAISGGRTLCVAMDGDRDEALGYLTPATAS